jgi:hypothetical protein
MPRRGKLDLEKVQALNTVCSHCSHGITPPRERTLTLSICNAQNAKRHSSPLNYLTVANEQRQNKVVDQIDLNEQEFNSK